MIDLKGINYVYTAPSELKINGSLATDIIGHWSIKNFIIFTTSTFGKRRYVSSRKVHFNL
jgi:hypothetical protein